MTLNKADTRRERGGISLCGWQREFESGVCAFLVRGGKKRNFDRVLHVGEAAE
jgi:hypothetical protein